jgi:hypothetical protein
MRTNPYEKYLGPEDRCQIQVCQYATLQYKGIMVHHSPNSGKRSKFEQYRLKILGVSSGYPDLVLVYKGLKIALELKVGKNKATEKQEKWIEALNKAGIPAKVCVGFDQSKEFIDKHFKPLK